jgi:hypothetical protein
MTLYNLMAGTDVSEEHTASVVRLPRKPLSENSKLYS